MSQVMILCIPSLPETPLPFIEGAQIPALQITNNLCYQIWLLLRINLQWFDVKLWQNRCIQHVVDMDFSMFEFVGTSKRAGYGVTGMSKSLWAITNCSLVFRWISSSAWQVISSRIHQTITYIYFWKVLNKFMAHHNNILQLRYVAPGMVATLQLHRQFRPLDRELSHSVSNCDTSRNLSDQVSES